MRTWPGMRPTSVPSWSRRKERLRTSTSGSRPSRPVRPGELLLHHARLSERARVQADDIRRLESRLEHDTEVERLTAELEQARAADQEVELRLRSFDRDREEVQHMKDRLASEEEAELALMEEAEERQGEIRRLQRELEAAGQRWEAARPGWQAQLDQARAELAELEAERDQAWARIPPELQRAAGRVRAQPPAAEVVGRQCGACRVEVTSSQMQALRRGEDIVPCENCG